MLMKELYADFDTEADVTRSIMDCSKRKIGATVEYVSLFSFVTTDTVIVSFFQNVLAEDARNMPPPNGMHRKIWSLQTIVFFVPFVESQQKVKHVALNW